MPLAPLVGDEDTKPDFIFLYQQKVILVNFAATISRPDVAKACSLLSEFLTKPSQQCMNAVDHLIVYLYYSRFLAIQFNGSITKSVFSCWSDASFADDVETRGSSEAFAFILYGGPIDWKATKQRTVTTSTTEAELLSLSAASREMIWWNRFFEAIHFTTDEPIIINCDNSQTVGIVEKETPKLITRLKHVDIHQMWLREQVQGGLIKVILVATALMVADGLTKLFGPQKQEDFIVQLEMVNLEDVVYALARKG